MDNNKDFEKLENELYKYFEEKKQKEVPLSTHYAIKNAFDRKRKTSIFARIWKIILYIFSIFTLVGGLVCAGDIANHIRPFFKSSREAVKVAAENGYIQDVKSNFVYDKDVGIKVDNVVLDDSNLNISYLYDYKENTNEIFLCDYEILDNNGNIVFEHYDKYIKRESEPLANTMLRLNQLIPVKENVYGESILYGSDKFPIIEKLYIHISKICVNGEKVIGNWNLEVDIDPKFNKREVVEYKAENEEHIIDSNFKMTETSLKVNLEVDEPYTDKAFGENRFMIEDSKGKKYICSRLGRKNSENSSMFYFEFDIGKYNENIDELLFKVKVNDNTTIETKLNKQ